MQLSERHQEYWRRNIGVTAVLLGLWFVITFVVAFFSSELNQVGLFGFPLGFYMAAQGSLIIYVIIIWAYARRMNKLDREYDVAEDDK